MNNRLFWKISLVFLILLVSIAGLYIYTTAYTSRNYFDEVNQKLNAHIASSQVKEVQPLVNGDVDTNAIQDIMHSMMVINPSVEVYLLDTEGRIITYVAPYKKVKLEKVSLGPIDRFISENLDGNLETVIKGDDPRNPGATKVFSAAPIVEDDQLQGYVYIILASEEQSSMMSTLSGSYILKIAIRTIAISILVALLLGILAFLYLTNNLRNFVQSVKSFKEGDMTVRAKTRGDFGELGQTFNQMADKITDNIKKLKSVEKFRTELIANVSHDLRTPLAVIAGYIETLLIKKDLSREEQAKYLKIVHNSSGNLSRLIDQLFEYSKLEADEVVADKEPFQLKDLIQDILMKFEVIAANKKIDVIMDAPDKLPMVYADIGLVERAISNLIDNAIKYGKVNGQVRVKLEQSPDEVTIGITDDGPGIPLADQSYIFERYRRGDRSKNVQSGAGLGLAIVKKILEIHDQSIKVLSESGRGASFVFNLQAFKA